MSGDMEPREFRIDRKLAIQATIGTILLIASVAWLSIGAQESVTLLLSLVITLVGTTSGVLFAFRLNEASGRRRAFRTLVSSCTDAASRLRDRSSSVEAMMAIVDRPRTPTFRAEASKVASATWKLLPTHLECLAEYVPTAASRLYELQTLEEAWILEFTDPATGTARRRLAGQELSAGLACAEDVLNVVIGVCSRSLSYTEGEARIHQSYAAFVQKRVEILQGDIENGGMTVLT